MIEAMPRAAAETAFCAAAGVLQRAAFGPREAVSSKALASAKLRREPLEHDLSHAAVGLSSLWFTLSWLVGGLAVWVMARNVAPDDADASRLLLVAVSGYLLAAGIGMFSIVVPAGVGVRDGVMVLLLTTQMSVSAATAVVVVARFLTVLADVVWAALGWLWAKSHDLLPDGGTPTTDRDPSP